MCLCELLCQSQCSTEPICSTCAFFFSLLCVLVVPIQSKTHTVTPPVPLGIVYSQSLQKSLTEPGIKSSQTHKCNSTWGRDVRHTLSPYSSSLSSRHCHPVIITASCGINLAPSFSPKACIFIVTQIGEEANKRNA